MFFVQFFILSIYVIVRNNADWVEIPLAGPTKNGGTVLSSAKTPMDVIFHSDQIENLESYNTTNTNKRILPEEVLPQNNRITTKPAKSSIMEVFTSSSTTEFTPLMSSISIPTTNSVTTPVPTTKGHSRHQRKNKRKKNKTDNQSDRVEIEEGEEMKESREEPQGFSGYSGFMPFVKSVQSNLLQRAHKTVKSKIQILKNLRDNLLYDIDQRIKRLWANDEPTGREHKGDYEMKWPSNEAALMTIGFLTLATFLVKLVLQIIAAIKAKANNYNMTTTTTTATMSGRKRRSTIYNEINAEDTYRILSLIDTYKVNNIDLN